MDDPAQRISAGADLGRAKRPFDLLLGTSAVAPLVACAAAAWLVPQAPASLVRLAAVIWGGSLLAFFAGVRRGLTFSEAGGGRAAELATMLATFAVGVLSLLLVSPAIAAVGLGGVGLLDAIAARRREAPGYFAAFRPPQMAVCVVSLALVQLRGG